MNGRRELLALYSPPRAAASSGSAVLMCNPFGQEAIRAHRLYRILGERLRDSGCHVLRFDYFGTGDSAGDDEQFDIDGAVGDIVTVAELLRQRSGVRSICLLGLRLGASLAMLGSLRMRELPAGLLLLDPVCDATTYIDQMREAHLSTQRAAFGARWEIDAALRGYSLGTADDEILGFTLTADCRDQMARRIHASAPWPGRAAASLVLVSDDASCSDWQAQGLRREVLESQVDWATNSAINTAIVPMQWVERVVRFVREEVAHA